MADIGPGLWSPCPICLGTTGVIDKDCRKCGGTDGYIDVSNPEVLPVGQSIPPIMHDWFAMMPLTSPIMTVDRIWMCLKCGETSTTASLPRLFGCDTTEKVEWTPNDDIALAIENARIKGEKNLDRLPYD